MTKEIWKDVCLNNKYQISNLGNFKKDNKKINGWIQNTGYRTVTINGKKYSIHRLVAEAFISNPENKPFVNHIDGNKLNNSIENLEWCTNKENVQHAFRTGLMDNAIKSFPLKKIRAKTIKQYDLQGNYLNTFKGSVEAQDYVRSLGIKVNARNIRNVCEGKRHKAGGFYWRYL